MALVINIHKEEEYENSPKEKEDQNIYIWYKYYFLMKSMQENYNSLSIFFTLLHTSIGT